MDMFPVQFKQIEQIEQIDQFDRNNKHTYILGASDITANLYC